MKTTATILITLLFVRSYSQQVRATFTIQGTTSLRDSGKMILIPVNTEDYYPFHGTMEAPDLNGKFSFTDSILYPTAYMIGFKYDSTWKYLSNPFFIEPGTQTLYCNISNLREIPAITNGTMHELQNDYSTSFAELHNQYSQYYRTQDSLHKVYKGKIPDSLNSFLSSIAKDLTRKDHSILLSYVRKKPGSYVALWKLINQLSAGYDPFYDSLYTAFSDTIRQTYTGKILKQKLDMARASCIGCRFPDVKFSSLDNLSQKTSLSHSFSKYTLIDIWFANCAPCINQFAEYKEIYARFKSRGFQMIGVSTDSKDQIPHWQKIINENKLPWPQYLDENGTMAKNLSINSWPSNFLVDDKGIIIQKNIVPKTLELFLRANIKSE